MPKQVSFLSLEGIFFIIREGVIYPAHSNLNTFKVLVNVYWCLFNHLKVRCESSTPIKRWILIFLLALLIFKGALFIKAPAELFSGRFILLEGCLVGFISLIFFKRVANYWLAAVAFIYMPAYFSLYHQYKLQAAFLKWGVVQFSWLFEDLISFEWATISFTGVAFFIFLVGFWVDLGFYKPGRGDVGPSVEERKDKILFSLLFLLSLVLRLLAYLDYPWVFSWYSSYVISLEIGGLAVVFVIIYPIFGLVLIFFFGLLKGAVISKTAFIFIFIIWRRFFFICLLVEIVAYLATRSTIKDGGFITRLNVITHSVVILAIFMYGIYAECFIYSLGFWRLLLEREQALFLNLANLSLELDAEEAQAIKADSSNRWWFDKILRAFLIKLDAWIRQADMDDVDEEDTDAIQYLTLGGKKYLIYQERTGLEFIRVSPEWSLLVVSDKFDIIKKTLVSCANFDSVQLQIGFINTLFSGHFWDIGGISIKNEHLWSLFSFAFCIGILIVCNYVFNQGSVFCELLMFIGIFMLVDFTLFLFWPNDLFRALVLQISSFCLLIWVYLMLELIFIVIKWAYKLIF